MHSNNHIHIHDVIRDVERKKERKKERKTERHHDNEKMKMRVASGGTCSCILLKDLYVKRFACHKS